MDSKTSENVASPELVRESLMAISQSTPDVIFASNGLPAKSDAPDAEDKSGGKETEAYRSKLISISYTQSPDIVPAPPVVENGGV